MKAPWPIVTAEDHDARELQQFGCPQQLRRSVGGFSSFAVAFSLMSVFTGALPNTPVL